MILDVLAEDEDEEEDVPAVHTNEEMCKYIY